mmetsp:Transcript_21575/g.53361  ORF Transcript_21575/g.53361 Transcript_21575/m.53361 type:complete len:833 (-) Transcript_21575:717-3215(-)
MLRRRQRRGHVHPTNVRMQSAGTRVSNPFHTNPPLSSSSSNQNPLHKAFQEPHLLIRTDRKDGVELISKSYFLECISLRNRLTYVRFPVGLTVISKRLFTGCTSLVDIDVPSSVTEIGDRAFCGCKSLAKLEFKEGLVKIGIAAFADSGLEHLRLPSTLKTIGNGAFSFCEKLESVILSPKKASISLGAFNQHTIAAMPNGSSHQNKQVTILPSLIDHGKHTFRHCKTLRHVDFSSCKYMARIGESVFAGCEQLKTVLLPKTNLVSIDASAFQDCTSLTHIHLPPTITHILKRAFAGCSKLQSIEVPKTTYCIEAEAFSECFSLRYAHLPEALKIISNGLFNGCEGLYDVNVPSTVTEIGSRAFEGSRSLSDLELPYGLLKIGSGAFSDSGIELLHVPCTVEVIGESAFMHCDELRTVILPPKLEIIREETFDCCTQLSEINIPASITEVGDFAFSDCGSLKSLDFSRCCNLSRIGEHAFSCCEELCKVLLPRTNLTVIEKRTFEWCTSLKYLWIPPTVTSIEGGAFHFCTSLLSLELPEGLEAMHLLGWCYVEGTEICRNDALVNLYIPSSQGVEIPEDEDLFFANLILSTAANDFDDLFNKLQHRFDDLPLHRVCYFQSYHTQEENLGSMKTILIEDPLACDRVDAFGMTPIHLLSLSQGPSLGLLLELLSTTSVDILQNKDVFGSTPLEYLCKNHSSKAIHVTKSLLGIVMEPRISYLRPARWRKELRSGFEAVQVAPFLSMKDKLDSFLAVLAFYEWGEVQCLVEMVLWKLKVDAGGMAQLQHGAKSAIATPGALDEMIEVRESSRVKCGLDVVLEHVMPFLDEIEPW